LQANQETLSKQLQTEKERAEKEHNELRKQLENVCALQFTNIDKHTHAHRQTDRQTHYTHILSANLHSQVQSTLQQQQRERREEEVHHKEMLMELQSLLARERGSKEDLALKVCTK